MFNTLEADLRCLIHFVCNGTKNIIQRDKKNSLACWSGIPKVWHLVYLAMCPLKNDHLMDG